MKRNVRTAALSSSALFVMAGAAVLAAPVASAAPGHVEVGICHATSSDTNPYVWIVVDEDSVQYEGHMSHKTDPNKTWKNAGSWNGTDHAAGDAKPDIIGGITQSECEAPGVITDGGTDDTTDPSDDTTDENTDPSDDTTDENTDPSDDTTDENTDPSDDTTDENTDTPTDGTDDSSTPPSTDVESDSQGGTQSVPSTGGAQASAELAHTGAASTLLLGLGAALVVTGAAFVVAGRKPENA